MFPWPQKADTLSDLRDYMLKKTKVCVIKVFCLTGLQTITSSLHTGTFTSVADASFNLHKIISRCTNSAVAVRITKV